MIIKKGSGQQHFGKAHAEIELKKSLPHDPKEDPRGEKKWL
jgi:hypothetical protein